MPAGGWGGGGAGGMPAMGWNPAAGAASGAAGALGGGGGSAAQALAMARRGRGGMAGGGTPAPAPGGGGLAQTLGPPDMGPSAPPLPPMDPAAADYMRHSHRVGTPSPFETAAGTGREPPSTIDLMNEIADLRNHLTAIQHGHKYPNEPTPQHGDWNRDPYVTTPEEVGDKQKRSGEVGQQLIDAGISMIPATKALRALKAGLELAEKLERGETARDWAEVYGKGKEMTEMFGGEEHEGHPEKSEKGEGGKPEHHARGGRTKKAKPRYIEVRAHRRRAGGAVRKALSVAKKSRTAKR